MHQPATFRVRIEGSDEGTVSNSARVDNMGHIVLSERDVMRIAEAVVERLTTQFNESQKAAPDEHDSLMEDIDQTYVPVRKNAERRPESDY